jgi:hypothetical protein
VKTHAQHASLFESRALVYVQKFIFSNFVIQSAKDNTIGFKVHIGLLMKVFAAASAIEAEHVQVPPCAPLHVASTRKWLHKGT